jgi:hypothetical protein
MIGMGRTGSKILHDLFGASRTRGRCPLQLRAALRPQGPLVVCYDLPGFDVGARPGTFDSCGIRNRLDYIFVTRDLMPAVTAGGLVRTGLWGTRKTRPTDLGRPTRTWPAMISKPQITLRCSST